MTVNSLDQICFIHHTVSEFLTSPSELWTEDNQLISKFQVDLPKAHELNAICCVKSLLRKTFSLENFDLQVQDDDHGYFEYASEYWAEHVSKASLASQKLVQIMREFFESENGMLWLKYRLQAPMAILTILSQLMLIENKLKIWSESSSHSDEFPRLTGNFVQTLYQRWHVRLKIMLPQSDPRLLESSNILAQTCFVKGNYSESAEIYISNMALAKQNLGTEDPVTLRSISGLATVRSLQGRWVEAINLAREALQGQIKSLGSMHQETLGSFELLGEAVIKGIDHVSGRTVEEMQKEGEELLQTSLQGRRNLLGKEHPDTLKSLHNFARALMAQKRYVDAEAALVEHQDIVRRVLGTDHRNYLHAMEDLAIIYLETGHPEKAEATHEFLLAQRRRLLAPDHPDIANSIWQLGALQQDLGRYEQAIANLTLLEPINIKSYGPNHRYTMKPMGKIGEMYVALKRYAEARPILERVVDTCDCTSVASIEMTRQSAKLLEVVYYQLGKKGKAKALKYRSWELQEPTDLSPTQGSSSWPAKTLLFVLLAITYISLDFLCPRLLNMPAHIGDIVAWRKLRD